MSPSSPATGTLVDIVDPVVPLSSPVTKTYSKTGVSPAAKQRENDAFDRMVVGEDATNSPKIDENDERENDAFDRMMIGGDATNSPKIDENDERENDAFDRMMVGEDATNSPKIDES